jgi:RNA polymerase sigma-70 factor (ECF subfamily)
MIQPADERSPIEEAYRREAVRLWRALVAFSAGRTEVADEAVSEAFARAVEHAGSIEDPVAWLYRVAFRIAARELARPRPVAANEPAAETVPHPDSEHDELYRALASLPGNQRAAVFLRYCHDLSAREIADRLGISPATVRVHLWRGRQRLRAMLEGALDE